MEESHGNMHIHDKYLWRFQSNHTSLWFTARPINLTNSVFSSLYETANHGESLLTETMTTLASNDFISQLPVNPEKVFFLLLHINISLMKGLVKL
jgi:hypothetical protein